MLNSRSILRQILTYLPSSVIPAVLTFGTSMIFTRIFSTEEYGIYSLFLVVAVSLRGLTTMWLQHGIGRYLPPEETKAGQIQIKSVIIISISILFVSDLTLGMIVILFVKPYFADNFQVFFLPFILFIITTSIFEIFSTIFPAEMKAKEFVFYKLFDSTFTFFFRLIVVLTFFSRDIKIMFWSVVISNGILIPLMWYRAGLQSILSLPAIIKIKENWKYIGTFMSYGFPMTLWYFSSVLLDVSDRFVLKYYLGNDVVGFYDANYRLIAGTVGLVLMPITLTLHPLLMKKSGTGNKKETGEVIEFIIENLFLVGLLFVCLVFIFHRDIALIALGSEFRLGSSIMPIVLAGCIFFNIGTFAHKPFEVEKKINIMLIVAIVSAILNLVLNFILIPFIGYIGAAYATLIAYIFYTILVGILGRQLIPWSIDLYKIFSKSVLLLTSMIAIFYIRNYVENCFSYLFGLLISLVLACVISVFFLFQIIKISNKYVKSH